MKKQNQEDPEELIKKTLIALEEEIDQVIMTDFGIKDPFDVMDEDRFRHIKRGSADGMVGWYLDEDKEIFVYAEAEVMMLPSDKELIMPLLREVLYINLILPTECRLGLRNETIYTAVMKHISDIKEGDIRKCINWVMKIADDLDDILIEKYGGTTKNRAN